MGFIHKLRPYGLLVVLLVFAPGSTGAFNRELEFILKRDHYELSYNEDHEVANWVYYVLERNQLQACIKRNNSFKPDPMIPSGSADLEDYAGSGYDRGHLLPAGDMKFNRKAMSETFYFSNIAPQPAKFNRGLWASLENLVRAWALKYERIWIVTGPVLHPGLPTIGKKTQVSVASEYFKVILRRDGKGYKGIGFLMETSLPHRYLNAYAVDIDRIEELTGHDFFPFLTQQEEAQAESTFANTDWDFKAEFKYLPCSSLEAQ